MTKKPTYEELEQKVIALEKEAFQQRRVEEELQTSVLRYRTLIESMPIVCFTYDREGCVLSWNKGAENVYGYTKQEAVGVNAYDLIVTSMTKETTDQVIKRVFNGEFVEGTEWRDHDKQGKVGWRIGNTFPLFKSDGTVECGVNMNIDITERKQLEKEIVEEKNFLNKLISLCPDGIIGVNRQGKIIIFNKAAEKLTFHKAEDVIDKMNVADIYESPEKARSVKKNMYSPEHGGQGRLQDFETEIVTREGHKIPIRLSATLIHKDGQEIGNVGFFHDISDKKQFEARLQDLSIRDSLSGLFNHRHFQTVLAEELSRTHRYKRPLSLICFDLDNFKQYNDNLGHLEGDNIIRFVGQYLKETMRSTDRIFRYGGDEFMILLPETKISNALFTAERIRQNFNSSFPYEAVCKKYDLKPVTLSLGVAEVNSEVDPEAVIERADLAMYKAKRAGGNRTVEAETKIGKTT